MPAGARAVTVYAVLGVLAVTNAPVAPLAGAVVPGPGPALAGGQTPTVGPASLAHDGAPAADAPGVDSLFSGVTLPTERPLDPPWPTDRATERATGREVDGVETETGEGGRGRGGRQLADAETSNALDLAVPAWPADPSVRHLEQAGGHLRGPYPAPPDSPAGHDGRSGVSAS